MMDAAIKLRPATLADVVSLERWDREPHVIRATTDDPKAITAFEDADWIEELMSDDPASQYLIAEVNGRLIGAMQVIDPALERSHYWGEDFPKHHRALDIWIGEKDCLGKGYGTQMMTQAIDRAFEEADVAAIVIDPLSSNKDAHRFYQRLGFEFVEQRFFDEDDCMVFKLTRKKWQNG